MPKFVEGYAAKLSVPDGQRDIQVFDDALPGFGIRKFASGKASYFVKFNVGTKQRRLTLGKVVQGNLAEMRKRASTVLSKARLGQDTVAEKRAAAKSAPSHLALWLPTTSLNGSRPSCARATTPRSSASWSVTGAPCTGTS